MSDKIKTLDSLINYVNKNNIKMFYGEPLIDDWNDDNVEDLVLSTLSAVGLLEKIDDYKYSLNTINLFKKEHKKYLCKLLELFINRSFNALIDVKDLLKQNKFYVARYDVHPAFSEAKCLSVSKDDFKIYIPYWTTKHLIQKNRVFKFICKVIDGLYFENKCYPYEYDNTPVYCGKLKKSWGNSFDNFYSKIKEWYKTNGR